MLLDGAAERAVLGKVGGCPRVGVVEWGVYAILALGATGPRKRSTTAKCASACAAMLWWRVERRRRTGGKEADEDAVLGGCQNCICGHSAARSE